MKQSYVAIMMEDTSTLLVAILGILKSGSCIVPINRAFPVDRVHFILNESAAQTRDKTRRGLFASPG